MALDEKLSDPGSVNAWLYVLRQPVTDWHCHSYNNAAGVAKGLYDYFCIPWWIHGSTRYFCLHTFVWLFISSLIYYILYSPVKTTTDRQHFEALKEMDDLAIGGNDWKLYSSTIAKPNTKYQSYFVKNIFFFLKLMFNIYTDNPCLNHFVFAALKSCLCFSTSTLMHS